MPPFRAFPLRPFVSTYTATAQPPLGPCTAHVHARPSTRLFCTAKSWGRLGSPVLYNRSTTGCFVYFRILTVRLKSNARCYADIMSAVSISWRRSYMSDRWSSKSARISKVTSAVDQTKANCPGRTSFGPKLEQPNLLFRKDPGIRVGPHTNCHPERICSLSIKPITLLIVYGLLIIHLPLPLPECISFILRERNVGCKDNSERYCNNLK